MSDTYDIVYLHWFLVLVMLSDGKSVDQKKSEIRHAPFHINAST